MGCCDVIIKNLIFLFNFVFFLTSAALIGIGAYIQVHMTKYLDFLGNTYLNTSVILIVLGGIMMIVTFFGCCGACTNNHCMMYSFATMLALILLSLIGVAITIYIYKDDAREIISQGMKKGMQEYNEDGHEGVTQTWNVMQSDFKCCGVEKYTDWKNVAFGVDGNVPDECCLTPTTDCGQGKADLPESDASKYINTKGCFAAFEDTIKDNVAAAAGVGVGIIVLLFLGVLVSCCVARNMKNEYNYV